MERSPNRSSSTRRSKHLTSVSNTTSPSSGNPQVFPRPQSFQLSSTASADVPRLRRNSTFANPTPSVPLSNARSIPTGYVPRLRRGPSFAKHTSGTALNPTATYENQSGQFPRLRRGPSLLSQSSTDSPGPKVFLMDPLARLRHKHSSQPKSSYGTSTLNLGSTESRSPDSYLPYLRRGASARASANISPASGSSISSSASSSFLKRSVRHSTSAILCSEPVAHGFPDKKRADAVPSPTSMLSVSPAASTPMRRMSLSNVPVHENILTCGMCNSCCGEGIKGMPPWAPERLKLLSEEERHFILEGMRIKQEISRLEAGLREKRNQIAVSVDRHLELRHTHEELVQEDSNGNASEDISDDTRLTSERTPIGSEDLESVDLGDGPKHELGQGARVRGNRRKLDNSECGRDGCGSDDDLIAPVDGSRGRNQIDDCGICEMYEQKVANLENQIDVVREVVKLCTFNEESSSRERAEFSQCVNRNQSWMGKIASAYFGHSVDQSMASNERIRLKEEIDVLQKATNFLFEKLQSPGDHMRKR